MNNLNKNEIARLKLNIASIVGRDNGEQKLMASIFISALSDLAGSYTITKYLVNPPFQYMFVKKFRPSELAFYYIYLISKKYKKYSAKKYLNTEKEKAMRWFDNKDKGFIYWCDLSGIEEDWLIPKVNKIFKIIQYKTFLLKWRSES